MPNPADVADAVANALNDAARPWYGAFTAARANRPIYALDELNTLRVPVVARGVKMVRATRSTARREVEVEIGLLKRLDDIEDAADELNELAEQIAAYFFHNFGLDDNPELVVKGVYRSMPDDEYLTNGKQYAAIVRLTVEVFE